MGSRCVVLCPDCKSQEIGFCSDKYKFDEFECFECGNVFSKEEAIFEEQ